MKRTFYIAALMLTLSGVAAARSHGSRDNDDRNDDGWRSQRHEHVVAPEIDPASAAGAVTLLLGGLVVLRGRRARG